MIKPNPDVQVLESEVEFYEAIQSADRPVVVLFWDGKDQDLMRSMPMGMRWLKNESESRKYFDFYKVQELDAKPLWQKYSPRGHEIIVFKNNEVMERFPGFIFASEINAKLMTYINKKIS